MVFSDLAPGDVFYFGILPRYSYDIRAQRTVRAEGTKLLWKKTNEDGLSICTSNGVYAQFDTPRHGTGTNKQTQSNGHRLFASSILCKFLNCSDRSWMIVEEGDIQPGAQNGCYNGFMSIFNDIERTFLQQFKMKYETPRGYTKKCGDTVEHYVFVGIPTSQQLGNIRESGTFGVAANNIYTWLADSDTLFKDFVSGRINRSSNGRYCNRIAPIIKIKDDTPVDVTEDGQYIIRIPEPKFEGNIFKFLGIDLKEAV